MTKINYYDIDENKLISNGAIEEAFYVKDLKQRKIFLDTYISSESVQDVVRHILQFNAEDSDIPAEERQPILLYVTSEGGEVDAGYSVIDAICQSKTPIYTVNLSYQYSMGFLIGIAGHKRFAMPNAKFLLHDGNTYVGNSTAKARETMEFYSKMEEKTRNYVIGHTKISEEEYDNRYSKEWYFDAESAKNMGITDAIIGEDCDIDEIV